MRVILISGHAQSGKDTTASVLKNILDKQNKRALIVHYADVLKFIAKQFFGWDGKKDEAGRKLLQELGTEGIRAQNENYFIDFICDILNTFPDKFDYVIIPDTRFKNEVYVMKDRFPGTVHIRIERPCFDNGLPDSQKAHPSETDLDNVAPDYLIINMGASFLESLEHIERTCEAIVQSLDK